MVTPKGNNILVTLIEENVNTSLIIPETATKKDLQWGVCVKGNEEVKTDSMVLFNTKGCFSKDGNYIVGTNKILYWHEQ